nr:MAG TPA: hypothetical protein [Caudoviricetes sp.]
MLEFIERLLSWLLLAFCIFMLSFTIVRLIVMIAYDFDVMLFLICIIVVFIESIFMYLSICLIIYGE